MNKSGKLLRISEERSIFVYQNEDGNYITKNNEIRYKNLGQSFEIKHLQESFVDIDSKGQVNVLDAAGKSKFHFPVVWLDTTYMKIQELQELGILQIKE